MSKSTIAHGRRGGWLKMSAVSVAAVLAAIQVTAEGTPSFNRVEEDWEIVITEPDPATNAPQLINVISPTSHTQGQYAVFEVNHITQPTYQQGGWQLQRWMGDVYHAARTSTPATVLSTPGETIRYTLAMSVTDGVLKFEVLNGQSQTWGTFGGANENLSGASPVPDLSEYRTALSVANAKVGYAAHRVARFRLKEVRYYSGNTLVQRDTTVRDIPVQGAS